MNPRPAGLRGARGGQVWLLGLVAALCALAPLLTAPRGGNSSTGSFLGLPSPVSLDPGAVLTRPSGRHWLGTDSLGRDVLSRLLHGGRTSLAIAAAAALASVLLGAFAGLWAGLSAGWGDLAAGRLMEIADCLPTLLVALAVAATPHGQGALPIIAVITATRWTESARLARGEALRWRATPRRESAQASGAGRLRIMSGHLLPALSPILFTEGALVAAESLGIEAALGVIGLGVAPPAPTWGNMLMEARFTLDEAWWIALFPGLAACAAIAGFLGLAERAGLDPAHLFGSIDPPAPVGGR